MRHGFRRAAGERLRKPRRGRRRGRPTLPRTGGTRSMSGTSWVTSLRLPPVTVQASGIPVASTKRWCLEPCLPRSTGLGPVAAPPFSTARGWSRRLRASTRSHPRPATRQEAARAAAPTHPPAATRPAAGNTSSPTQSQAPAAGAATRSQCAAQTGSPAARPDRRAAFGPDSENDAPAWATRTPLASTAHRRRSTARQPSAPPSLTADAIAFVARERVPSECAHASKGWGC
jgi:hypothetical protein